MENPKIACEIVGAGQATVSVKGTLDITGFPAFRDSLQKMVQFQNVILDLTEVNYINSTCWSVIISLAAGLRRRGGGMVVLGMREPVAKVFAFLNIKDMVQVASSMAEAGQYLVTAPKKE